MNKSQKKFVFVLMPFDELFNDIYSYGIKQTCIELDAYCERVDEQIFNERILDRIYNQIAKADIIIADMTSRNANVFYEVGFAHGIGKNVILLTKNSEDIPLLPRDCIAWENDNWNLYLPHDAIVRQRCN